MFILTHNRTTKTRRERNYPTIKNSFRLTVLSCCLKPFTDEAVTTVSLKLFHASTSTIPTLLWCCTVNVSQYSNLNYLNLYSYRNIQISTILGQVFFPTECWENTSEVFPAFHQPCPWCVVQPCWGMSWRLLAGTPGVRHSISPCRPVNSNQHVNSLMHRSTTVPVSVT